VHVQTPNDQSVLQRITFPVRFGSKPDSCIAAIEAAAIRRRLRIFARPNRALSSNWGRCSGSYRVYGGPLGEQSTGTKISATAKHGGGLPSERSALGIPLLEVW